MILYYRWSLTQHSLGQKNSPFLFKEVTCPSSAEPMQFPLDIASWILHASSVCLVNGSLTSLISLYWASWLLLLNYVDYFLLINWLMLTNVSIFYHRFQHVYYILYRDYRLSLCGRVVQGGIIMSIHSLQCNVWYITIMM